MTIPEAKYDPVKADKLNGSIGEVEQSLQGGKKSKAYGGGVYELPQNHLAGMIVPRGGSCCANCRFLKDEKHCGNEYWLQWNNGANNGQLPAPDDMYCCDWFEV